MSTPPAEIAIAGRAIGPDRPPYVIAELSGNHNGRIERAFALIEAAKEAGADAVKLQTYTADTMTIDCDGEDFVIRGGLWDGRRLYELYQEASTPWDWHPRLFEKGRELGITVFSTPFDETAVEFLQGLDAPAYKIASFELLDPPLIQRCARTGRPLIVSTGMSTADEIAEALATARAEAASEIVLLHCVSSYPAATKQANVRSIPYLASTFGVQVGLSDHTLDNVAAVSAVALGATVLEKHFTLRRTDGGPDAAFSLEPEEFRKLVQDVRAAWEARGESGLLRTEAELEMRRFRRSLYAVKDIRGGEPISRENVRAIRPGFGLAPKHLGEVVGRKAAQDIRRGEPLTWAKLA